MHFLWVVFTLLGAAGQVARNALQRGLTAELGALGATLVRFLFGLPFALAFLGALLAVTGAALPLPGPAFGGWIFLGALTQIAGTALMLKAMEHRSFVVVTAYLKTEPVLVALIGLSVLGDPLTMAMALAIMVAMAGVMLISARPQALAGGLQPALLGLAAAALFAASSVGYRGAILSLNESSFVLSATVSLAAGLTLQTALLVLWLLLFRRNMFRSLLAHWKPSLTAGFAGAAASQCWFLAFALASAASVRTLALVEILLAQGVTRFIFKQQTTPREATGIGLLLAGAILIVWVSPKP